MHWIDTTVTLACNNFVEEGITNEMVAQSKVFQLVEIVEDIRIKGTDLEAHLTPSTPPEVLEGRRQVTTDAAKKIE